MASVIDICAASSDKGKALAEFKNELNDIQQEFLAEVSEITDSENAVEVNKLADEALEGFDALFAASTLGSLGRVQDDSNIPRVNRSYDNASKHLSQRGYLIANNQLLFSGTQDYPLRSITYDNGTYKYIGVADGEYSFEQLAGIIPGYTEPDIQTILKNQTQKRVSNTGSNFNASQVAVDPDGNVARLRSLYLGCGSLKILREFLEVTKTKGYGVVWSVLESVRVTRPFDIDFKDFNEDYVRTVVKTPLDDSKIIKLLDSEYLCLVEKHIGVNITKTEAAELSGTTGMICRVVLAEKNECLRDQAPVFVSRGFNPKLLGTDSYLIGLKVNGIARVIDVTSDNGARLYCEEDYSASDIAGAIRSTFPDFVDTGVVGSEFFVTTKGSGAYTELEFFQVDSNDASEALGIESMVRQQYETNFVFDKPLALFGGASIAQNTTFDFTQFVTSLGLSDDQTSAILANSNRYWNDAKTLVSKIQSEIESSFNSRMRRDIASGSNPDTSKFKQALDRLNDVTSFEFIEGLRCFESMDILNVFGSDADYVLSRRLETVAVDPYSDLTKVYGSLSTDFATLQSSQGLVNKPNPTVVIQPREVNKTQASTATLLYYAMVESSDSGNTSEAVGYYDRFEQSLLGMSVSNSPTSSVSTEQVSVETQDRLLSDFLYALDHFKPMLVVDANEVARETAAYIKRNYPETYAAIAQASDYIKQQFAEVEKLGGRVSEILGVTGALDTLGGLMDDGIVYLKKVDAILATTQNTVRGFAATYQQTYDKIMSLSNIGMNVYSNNGFQTKYLSCYVSGSASLLLGKVLEKYLSKINELADKLNSILQKIIKALQKFFDKILCLVKNISLSVSGYASYSTTYPGFAGMVQFNMNCTVSTGLGLDPQILGVIAGITSKIMAMLNMFKLQIITFEQQDASTQAVAAQVQADLMNTLREALDRLKRCL